MDPKEKDTKWSKMPPKAKLESLRRLRDERHKLKSKDRPYDQEWFMEAVVQEHLEQVYIDDVAENFRT